MSAGPILPFNSFKSLFCYILGLGHKYKIIQPDFQYYPFDLCTKCGFKGDDYGPG